MMNGFQPVSYKQYSEACKANGCEPLAKRDFIYQCLSRNMPLAEEDNNPYQNLVVLTYNHPALNKTKEG